jgi:hypothetical protein
MSISRLVLAVLIALLILQLNIYFAWTSHVGEPTIHSTTPVRSWLVNQVNSVTKFQLSIPGVSPYFASLAHRSHHFGSTTFGIEQRYFIDYEVVAFTVLIFMLSLVLFMNKGKLVPILRALEITSAAVLPLGIEIYLFDYGEFNIHASVMQVKAGIAWFTNADLLYLSASILALAVVIDLVRYRRTKKSTEPSKPTSLLQENYPIPNTSSTS